MIQSSPWEFLYEGQFDRTDELNSRLFERNIPTHAHEVHFGSRPVQTKYTKFPCVDVHRSVLSKEPIHNAEMYNQHTSFVPAKGPWSGYSANIEQESMLHNLYFANQKSDQAAYIPSSQSDLYNTIIASREGPQPHSLLFESYEFATVATNKGPNLFHNDTRQQRMGNSDR